MALHLEFLDEVSSFLEMEMLGHGLTPRGSMTDEGLEQLLLADESPPGWETILPSPSDESTPFPTRTRGHTGSSNSECDSSPTKRNKRRNEVVDARRQKYRMRVKSERDELRQLMFNLTQQVEEILEATRGTHTTARTDLALSKSFWKQVAIQQRQRRQHAEKDKARLLAIVNSQAAYLESLGVTLRECPSWPSSVLKSSSSVQLRTLDDRRWLRLKSSDSAAYQVFLQDVQDNYVRVDKVFEECEMESLSIGAMSSLRQYNPNGKVESTQYMNKWLQPFSFEDTCSNMWKYAEVPHRQTDRQVNENVVDSDNTIALKFRLQKTLSCGSIVSILKRVVSRRFFRDDRVVMVWKVFLEGEGIFSGMDVDESGWVRIRPHSDGGALTEVYSRHVPVPYLVDNADDPTVTAFQSMLQEAVQEDEREIMSAIAELLHARSLTASNSDEGF